MALRSRVVLALALARAAPLAFLLASGCSLLVSTSGLDDGPATDASTNDGRREGPDSRPRADASKRDSRAPDAAKSVDATAHDSRMGDAKEGVDAPRGVDSSRPDSPGNDSRVDSPVDARHDVAHPVDSTPPDWCSTQSEPYTLCADFDTGPVTASFDLGLAPNGVGGSFQLDPADFVSSPNSALGVADPYFAGGSGGDLLEGTLWSFGASPTTFRCSLQWNPRALSTVANDYAHILAIEVNDTSGDQIVNLSVQIRNDGSLVFLEDYPNEMGDQNHTIAGAIALDTWYPVEMAFTISGGATSFTVSVGGQPTTGSLVHGVPMTSGGLVEVGPAYFAGDTTTGSPGWTFAYDNVLCK